MGGSRSRDLLSSTPYLGSSAVLFLTCLLEVLYIPTAPHVLVSATASSQDSPTSRSFTCKVAASPSTHML